MAPQAVVVTPMVLRSPRVALLAIVAGSLTAAALATSGVALAADPIGSGAPEHHGAAAAALDISSHSIVTGPPAIVPPRGRAATGALCPSGTLVLGGGEHNDSVAHVVLTDSYPAPNCSAWRTIVINDTDGVQHATAYAVCGR